MKNYTPESVNRCSAPSELKITDIRVCNIDGIPKHCILIKVKIFSFKGFDKACISPEFPFVFG